MKADRHFALPLLIENPRGLVVEMTDGTADYNSANYRFSLEWLTGGADHI